MDYAKIISSLDKPNFTRQDIFRAAQSSEKRFRESQMRNLMEYLQKNKYIMRISRNCYIKVDENDTRNYYEGIYSNKALELREFLIKRFPHLKFQIWELNWMNEFLNHMIAHNMIFLEIENDGCEFVYTALKTEYSEKMLLRPLEKELNYYADDNIIIVDRLISESPSVKNDTHTVLIEKLIVDLFANRIIKNILSQAEYANILQQIFSKYRVDQAMLFRYARRRNKNKVIADYILKYTTIELLIEVQENADKR